MVTSLITKIFGSKYDRDLKKIHPIVITINEYYEKFRSLSEEDLKAKTDEFKERLRVKDTKEKAGLL